MFQPKSIQQCLVMGRLYEKVQAHQKREVVKKKSDDSKKVSQSPNVSSTVEGASLNNSPVHHYLPTDKESSKEKQSLQHEVSVDVESLLQQKLETKTLNQDKHELCVSPGDLPNVSQSFNVPCESMSRLKCWKFKFKPEIVAIKQQHNQVLSFLEPSSSCHKVAMVVVDDLSSDLSVMAGNGRELTVFQVEWSVKEEFVNKLQTELDISVRDEISEEKFFTHSHQAEHVWEPGGLSAKENQWDWQKQGSIVQGRYELQKQTLQDLQQFTFGDEQFQIKHKWRTECARHRLRHRQKKGKGSKSWNFKFKLEKKNIQHHHNQIRPASQDFFKRNLRGYQGDRVQWMFQ
ncbi:PREDICTED: uncharacterized protein LOC109128176 [Camelina sativa]|uniref:Uncharacterized protein LOC109128176 n=1 Tax=Camelina sativa TaxID=90675 RepID=A0ABM1QS31_CAMSA|nr:PREDICTED: uncharacterized protein LOC109128176 [Camelina sativa]